MLYAMRSQGLQPHKVSFQVADVAPGTERLGEITVREAVERTARTKLLTLREPSRMVVAGGDFHPLIAAAAIAYKKHFPLVLSPDIIWLTILQGVAQHVANHSASLRSRLVTHQTKIELVVDTNLLNLPQSDPQMMAVTRPFLQLFGKHLLADKQFLLNAEFSTTTDAERIAHAIVIMDAFQPYFDYVFSIICGIPSITLEGTVADWELLRAKVRALHESDLEISWWTKHLLPLCDHFVSAAQGDADREHWNNLCKLVERYGVDDLNGWLLKFIPYVSRRRNELPQERNPVLELEKFSADSDRMGEITGCTSNMLPTGLSFAPVTCVHLTTAAAIPYRFIAGFTGVTQSPEDFGLHPLIGWAIAEAAPIDRLIGRLRSEQQVLPPEPHDTEDVLRAFERNLPGDLWRFYAETGGAILESNHPERKIVCTINSFKQIKPAVDSIPAGDDERRKLRLSYSNLRVFAESTEGANRYFYAIGSDPEIFQGTTIKESRGNIFRWTGEFTREAFEPIAHSFSEWLEGMLDRAK